MRSDDADAGSGRGSRRTAGGADLRLGRATGVGELEPIRGDDRRRARAGHGRDGGASGREIAGSEHEASALASLEGYGTYDCGALQVSSVR